MKSELGQRLEWLAANAPLANALKTAQWKPPGLFGAVAVNYQRWCLNWQVRAR